MGRLKASIPPSAAGAFAAPIARLPQSLDRVQECLVAIGRRLGDPCCARLLRVHLRVESMIPAQNVLLGNERQCDHGASEQTIADDACESSAMSVIPAYGPGYTIA